MNFGKNDSVAEYAALGRFIAQCSVLEMCLHACVKHILGLQDETARLLVGEPRIGDLIDLLKKSARINNLGAERTEVMVELLAECVNGNKVRQIVAHKPFFMDGSVLVFHNKMSAKSLDAVFEYRCSIEELNNAALLTRSIAQDMLGVVMAEFPVAVVATSARENLALWKKFPLPKIPGQPLPPKPPKQPRRQKP